MGQSISGIRTILSGIQLLFTPDRKHKEISETVSFIEFITVQKTLL